MLSEFLQKEINNITLSIGDVIIEESTRGVGILYRREHRIDILQDDLYFWEIKWTSGIHGDEFNKSTKISLWEEEQLKLSIILGIIKWQSINGGSFEL
tara:strand:+ start:3942 stop:4235 length:294 start_codon:yes stop_codon:yes gene_type:complete